MVKKIIVDRRRNYWKLIARNGKTLAHSETYDTFNKARNIAEKVAEQLGGVPVETVASIPDEQAPQPVDETPAGADSSDVAPTGALSI